MSESLDFARPLALLLLPLAVLPLLRGRRGTVGFSHLPWLPADRLGEVAGAAWRAVAVLAILSTALALAGPGRSETSVMRTGRGAEILVLMDRSRSMDDRMLTSDWRTLDPLVVRAQSWSRGEQKGKVARDLLAKFVAERPDDRFALMFFSASPIHVVPFTQHDEVVQAAITAGGIGRGLSDTDVGAALIAAIKEFDRRPYTGSRIVLLVSDGGANLDEETRETIRAGLGANRIALNWIYLRSVNGPDFNALSAAAAPSDNAPPGNAAADNASPDNASPGNTSPGSTSPDNTMAEIVLHRFFQTLETPYRAYQAETPEDLAQAIAEVGKQQNFPLDFLERIPRQDFSRHCLAAAALCCLMLLILRSVQLQGWR